jgi:hypothetical protein
MYTRRYTHGGEADGGQNWERWPLVETTDNTWGAWKSNEKDMTGCFQASLYTLLGSRVVLIE